MLAGGIVFKILNKALQQHCLGIDLNSGVECANKKDQIKLQTVFNKIKNPIRKKYDGAILNPYFWRNLVECMYRKLYGTGTKTIRKGFVEAQHDLCFGKNFRLLKNWPRSSSSVNFMSQPH